MFLLVIGIFCLSAQMEGALAGGRPNSVSGGINAFAGIANPASAVWVADRYDLGFFWVHQNSSINNRDNNPLFPPGKFSTSYRKNNLYSFDAAITKQFKFEFACRPWEASLSLTTFSTPTHLAVKTKRPILITGTTPILLIEDAQAFSAIFSFKLNPNHSVGFSLDYYYLWHKREGFQNADNATRSVSPGHVTNNGTDHSSGLGLSLGWLWKINSKLTFGLAWARKSYVGQYRKYRGYEPHHAKNFIPQTVGVGLGYRFTPKMSGRLELLWINSGNLPGANRTVLRNGKLNPHKFGSNKSPGPALQDATIINMGIGYQFTPTLALGVGFSHRIKNSRQSSNILTHPYTFQAIYDLFTVGAYYIYQKHEMFFSFTQGFKNRVHGNLPTPLGGGRFATEKGLYSLSFTYGYLY